MAGEQTNATQRIDAYMVELGGWRGEMLSYLRKLIISAAPELVEEWKWGTPVWSCNGNVVAVGAFKNHLKINFFNGISLDDSHGLFNAGLDAKAMRSIDLFEGDSLSEEPFRELVRSAVAVNQAGGKRK